MTLCSARYLMGIGLYSLLNTLLFPYFPSVLWCVQKYEVIGGSLTVPPIKALHLGFKSKSAQFQALCHFH